MGHVTSGGRGATSGPWRDSRVATTGGSRRVGGVTDASACARWRGGRGASCGGGAPRGPRAPAQPATCSADTSPEDTGSLVVVHHVRLVGENLTPQEGCNKITCIHFVFLMSVLLLVQMPYSTKLNQIIPVFKDIL